MAILQPAVDVRYYVLRVRGADATVYALSMDQFRALQDSQLALKIEHLTSFSQYEGAAVYSSEYNGAMAAISATTDLS